MKVLKFVSYSVLRFLRGQDCKYRFAITLLKFNINHNKGQEINGKPQIITLFENKSYYGTCCKNSVQN